MKKTKQKFNPKTLMYEVITLPFKIRFYRVLRKILIGFIIASIANLFFSYFVYTPKMYRLAQHNNNLVLKYSLLEDKIIDALDDAKELKLRNNYIYRSVLGQDTISISGIYNPYPDTKYSSLTGGEYTPIMVDVWKKLDELSRKVYAQSVSLDTIEILAKDKGKMAEAVPAIWPMDRKLIRNNVGAFGYRRHPILGYIKFHTGVDMGSNTGTPIYATGNGVVREDSRRSGYGIQVLIDHGFGYKTRYAHLSKATVKVGDTVMRGEKIGEMGNTGRSTSAHLHYEVLFRNTPVNPFNYLSKMPEEDFKKIVESANETTFED